MVVTTTTTAVTVAIGAAGAGGVVLLFLIGALIAKEVLAHSGNVRLVPLHRALTIALVPLALAVAFVLAQQVASIA
jgi:hypothetical protein